MGEIADDIVDGVICQLCCRPIEDYGYPRTCDDCQEEDRPVASKVHSPDCGKRVKVKGLKDHRRDAHGNN